MTRWNCFAVKQLHIPPNGPKRLCETRWCEGKAEPNKKQNDSIFGGKVGRGRGRFTASHALSRLFHGSFTASAGCVIVLSVCCFRGPRLPALCLAPVVATKPLLVFPFCIFLTPWHAFLVRGLVSTTGAAQSPRGWGQRKPRNRTNAEAVNVVKKPLVGVRSRE